MKDILTNTLKTVGLVTLDGEKAEVIGFYSLELLNESLEAISKIFDIFSPLIRSDNWPTVKVEVAIARNSGKIEDSTVLLFRLKDNPGHGWIALAPMKDVSDIDKTAGD